ncbi:hypothetical protein BDA96_03G266200 [Sorghum bicolor]|uniref:CASP-like protein n=3 Tax=Sorghum bicolor TaxID=4558 RepID=C5XFW5_SORBI|nr:hypothetical protein SORBI_3003G245900 [Sorghum bicolor]KAG0538780.1 hypothetical protein BDA96_03G266200 [Sorghum bicolor]
MASPTRAPAPPPAVEPIAPSSPSSEHPPVKPSDGSLSPENPAPAPPPPPATSPPHTPGDSSPSSTPHPSAPQPSPPSPPPPPLPPSADVSPPLPRDGQTSPPRPLPPPSPAPVSTPTPAPASSEAKSEQEEAESASESGSMTLAVVLAQTEESTPRKASSAEASPAGSPQKESAVTIAKLLSGEDPAATVAKATPDKVTPPSDTGSLSAAAAATAVGGVGGGVGSKRWLLGGVPEKVRRAELRRAELGFRVSAAVFCLVALSVMAADTTTGWSGDSFRRYNEYRYVLAASVLAFTYSGFQLVAEVHYLVTGRRIIRAPFRSYFNLAMDQMLAYLLLSASSAALSRNDVWMSRFGGDQFTKLINASASMAFLAFIALGLNSVISAYCVFSLVS